MQAKVLTKDEARCIAVNVARGCRSCWEREIATPDNGVAMTRQYIIAAIVGIILVTSLRLGAFPAATAVAMTLTGATVILMMASEGWP